MCTKLKRMKYFEKIDFKKVNALKAKMTTLSYYDGLAAITLTNEGTKENPKYRIDKLVENSIEPLGFYDFSRLVKEANEMNYNIGSYFGIGVNDVTPTKNEDLSAAYILKSTNAVGIISRITNLKLIRINEIV